MPIHCPISHSKGAVLISLYVMLVGVALLALRLKNHFDDELA